MNEDQKIKEILRLRELNYPNQYIADKLGITYRQLKYMYEKYELLSYTNNCRECGQRFTGEIRGLKYCSKKCMYKNNYRNTRIKRYRLIRTGKKYDPDISIDRLAKRDGTWCWLCDEPCDKSDHSYTPEGYFKTGPRYPTIDHVVPLCMGGTHSWDNVRLAHHYCNIIKRDFNV